MCLGFVGMARLEAGTLVRNGSVPILGATGRLAFENVSMEAFDLAGCVDCWENLGRGAGFAACEGGRPNPRDFPLPSTRWSSTRHRQHGGGGRAS